MKYSITINTKNKTYPLITNDLESFLKIIRESSIIWLNGNEQGFWIPHSEITEIIFQKAEPSEVTITPEPPPIPHE